LADLYDVHAHAALSRLGFQQASQLVNFVAILSDDDTRFRRMHSDQYLIGGGALDLDL
jgi:hypothetical protein